METWAKEILMLYLKLTSYFLTIIFNDTRLNLGVGGASLAHCICFSSIAMFFTSVKCTTIVTHIHAGVAKNIETIVARIVLGQSLSQIMQMLSYFLYKLKVTHKICSR
jgi:hypothetical protein